MTQSLSTAQQTQLENRDSTGQWKQKTHGQPDADADPLGLNGQDPGEAAFDALKPDEQSAWYAWRQMTGKSEETVVGPSKAADIAEFQQHYLASGFEGENLPDMGVAQRLGLDSDEERARHQWDEMLSQGTIEHHEDEESGDQHFFAHPHLARALTADDRGASASAAADDDDDEPEWETIEPDFDDYRFSADDAHRMAGLENLQHGEIYWDHEQAYSSARPQGPTGSLGFNASGSFDDIDTDYLDEDLASSVKEIQGTGRSLSIANYSGTSRSALGEQQQYVSVSLSADEREAVLDALEADDDTDFAEDRLSCWESGNPSAMQDTFGFVSPSGEWQKVSGHVRRSAPEAGNSIDVAEALRRDANSSFESEVEHMRSED